MPYSLKGGIYTNTEFRRPKLRMSVYALDQEGLAYSLYAYAEFGRPKQYLASVCLVYTRSRGPSLFTSLWLCMPVSALDQEGLAYSLKGVTSRIWKARASLWLCMPVYALVLEI